MNHKKNIFFIVPNFQTRSILIPYDEFLVVPERAKQYDTLKLHAAKNVKITIDEQDYIIDNLILENIVWSNGYGRYEKRPHSEITHDLTQAADGAYENHFAIGDGSYSKYDGDVIWLENSNYNIASSGFNHIKNYCYYRDNHPIDVEIENDKLKTQKFDTVDDMLVTYYLSRLGEHIPS